MRTLFESNRDGPEAIMQRLLQPQTYILLLLWGMLSFGNAAYGQAAPTSPTFQLAPAAPNPFQTQTTFTLSVSTTQPVRIELFNLLGQRVRLVYEGVLSAGTPYVFQIEAGDLPNGLYLYRIQGSTFSVTRRLLLMR